VTNGEDPREYLIRLRTENENFYNSDRGRGALDLLEQTFPEPWLYIAELIQNAVDAKATVLRFVIDGDALVFEHDGKPFDSQDVRGLCSQALSTKGFGTVGFMGVGFKAVFSAFETASIASGPWRFSLTVPVRRGPFNAELRDWLGAVLPAWNDDGSPPSAGMECRFTLTGRRQGLGSVEADLDNVFQEDASLLALLALRGVREVYWKDETWLLERQPIGTSGFFVYAVGGTPGEPKARLRSWVVFAARHTPSESALRRLVEHRRQAVLHGDPSEAKRERQVVLFCEVDERNTPRPPASGRAFALLATNLVLPLRVHLDAEWLLALTRREPMHLEGDAWHEEILDTVPELLRDFITWIAARADLTPAELKEALEVLPDFQDETRPAWRWFLQQRIRDSLRDHLAEIAFVPGLPSHDVLPRLTPAEAKFLPDPLSRALEDPEYRPADLFGPVVASRKLVGPRARACLEHLKLWQEVEPNELAAMWEGGRVGTWFHNLPENERDRYLVVLLAALGELADGSEPWSNAALRCLPTNGGTWIVRVEVIRLPAEWDSVPEEIQAGLLPHAGPSERVVRWEIDRALTQRSSRRHYLGVVQSTPLMDLALRWWESLPETNLSEADVEASRYFASWVRSKALQRRDLVRKLLCVDIGGGLHLQNGEDCLLAEPYAGSWRRAFFRDRLVVAPDYLQDGASAAEWRRFLESGEHAPEGEFRLLQLTEVLEWGELAKRIPPEDIPATRSTWLQKDWRGTELPHFKYGWVDFQLPRPLAEQLSAAPLPRMAARMMQEWMTEAAGSLSQYAHCLLAFIPYGSGYVTERKLHDQPTTWVRVLREVRWIYSRTGEGPFRPDEVLPVVDTARARAPVADLPDALISELQRSGITFGHSIEEAPAAERLRLEGQVAPPDRLLDLLTQAIAEADTAEKRSRLDRILDETALFPVPVGHITPDEKERVPRVRLVKKTGSPRRGELAGWVVAVEAFSPGTPERAVLEAIDDFTPLPSTTSGWQALDFLLWVWTHAPEADRVRRALPLAYAYLNEDLRADVDLQRRWQAVRVHARVFTNRRRWASIATDQVFFDDLPRGTRRTLMPSLELATAGHLGELVEQQIETADLLGLPRLSSRFRIDIDTLGLLEVPETWTSGILATWQLLLAAHVATTEGMADVPSAATAPVVGRYVDIREIVRDLDPSVDGHAVERSLHAFIDGDKLCIAGEPADFAGDVCELLLDRLGRGLERRFTLKVASLLSLLDDPSKLQTRLTLVAQDYGLVFPTASPAGNLMGQVASQLEPARPSPTASQPSTPPAVPVSPVEPGAEVVVAAAGVPASGGQSVPAPPAPQPGVAQPALAARTAPHGGGTYTSRRRESELAAHLRAIERLRALGLGVNEDREDVGASSDAGERAGLEEPYRRATLLYEVQSGRHPIAKDRLQEGHDIDSFSHPEGHADRRLERRIEVKGRGASWTGDEVVELSRRQFRDAFGSVREEATPVSLDFDYWVYVVEEVVAGQYSVLPIRNPARRAGAFELRGGTWRALAEESQTVFLTGAGVDRDDGVARATGLAARDSAGDAELMPLIDPQQAPAISGVASPSELYWVLQVPAPLAGMRYPRWDFPWKNVADTGFHFIVSLHPGDYDPSPLERLSAVQLEDLAHGGNPVDPAREKRLIRTVVDAVVRALQAGRGVILHCVGGRGRSGTVIGCVLRTLGYRTEEIISYLDRTHKARGKMGWPESPWQADLIRQWGVDA
jgi:hypothetical protein